MKLFSRFLNTRPKKVAMATTAVLMAAMLPVASLFAAANVKLEGSLGVLNVTRGETRYTESASASYDQVLKVQVYYHNTELPESGKIAENVNIKLDVPTTAGKSQTVRATIAGDNTNTVTDSVAINLDRDDAYLEYIPGSATWKHNVGGRAESAQDWKTETVSDNVVLGGAGLRLENQKPCFEYAATLTALIRVRVPGVTIDKQVRKAGTNDAFVTQNTAKPEETLEYRIVYKNTGNTVQNDVIVGDNLPPKFTLVPGTTYLANAASGGEYKKYDSNNVTSGGINIGNYGAGANAYVKFQVKVPAAKDLACGVTEFRNVGLVRPKGMHEYFNTAITKVTKECEPTQPENPAYKCDSLTVVKTGNGREIKADVEYTATNGAKLKQITYTFGDGKTLTTDKTSVNYTYAKDGTYNVVAKLLIEVDGTTKTVTSASCEKPVTFSTPPVVPPETPENPEVPESPEELPITGPADVALIVAGVSAVSALGYRFFLSRRG